MARTTSAGDVDYDAGGATYASRRRPEPRIAALIMAALGNAQTVLNVGAGTGSYEPTDRTVMAVEPSATMRSQRPADLLPAVDAVAEARPFDSASFDAAMAILTVHQWPGVDQGLRELRRVSRGPVVVMTSDCDAQGRLWLRDYAPVLYGVERPRFPTIDHIRDVLGGSSTVTDVPVPLDCIDGFAEAYYGRPEAFLDPGVRQAQSGWSFVDPSRIDRFVAQLGQHLADGTWDARYGHLRTQPEFIGSLRLIRATA
jgi:SAM-dependent methyltransferase